MKKRELGPGDHVYSTPLIPRRRNVVSFVMAALLVVLLAVLVAVSWARAETITTRRDGFLTRSQGDGWSAESYDQGSTTHTTITTPGKTTTCRTWKQGWQQFTQCD